MEFLATSSSTFQNSIIIENDDDYNGYLLYPDGAPRFRTIYTNGGSATSHGNSLGEDGRQRIRDFFHGGGCYTGSCAGAFIASLHYEATGIWDAYYHIWPGRTASTGVTGVYTGHYVEPGAALLDYYDFGGDMFIDNIYHNGGCYARETIDYPPETEIQLRYDYSGYTMNDKASCWAYKGADTTGRLVVIGSHPEGITSGERLDLMCAILQYALAGQGTPRVKGELFNGEIRIMSMETIDGDPSHAKIGDLQYHHFYFELPEGARDLAVRLEGTPGYDFKLFLRHGDFAFRGTADFSDTTEGSSGLLGLLYPETGIWYVGVKCDTTIQAVNTTDDYYYTGALELLNGLTYTISVSWDTTLVEVAESKLANSFELFGNYPNPFNDATSIEFELLGESEVGVSVFSTDGRLVRSIDLGQMTSGKHSFVWNSRNNLGKKVPSGIYLYRIETDFGSKSGRAFLVR